MFSTDWSQNSVWGLSMNAATTRSSWRAPWKDQYAPEQSPASTNRWATPRDSSRSSAQRTCSMKPGTYVSSPNTPARDRSRRSSPRTHMRLLQRRRDRLDAREHAALENPVGELDVEAILEREHHGDPRVRGDPRLIRVIARG